MKKIMIVTTVLFAVALSAGCGTGPGGGNPAQSGLIIKLENNSGGAVPSGNYTVAGLAIEGPKRCQFDVPGNSGSPDCLISSSFNPEVQWTGYSPTTITVIITRDGKPLLSKSDIKPTYNGGAATITLKVN